jgi:hypothetical protein
LEKYQEKIYPLIEKVHHVQKDIEGGPGVLDAIVDIKHYGTVLLDHKTSGRPYDRDAVKGSTQLALYASREGITQAGFVVLVKNINKDVKKTCIKCGFDGSGRQHKTCFNEIKGNRCNGAWIEEVKIDPIVQLIVDDVPARNMQLIEESISDAEYNIEHGKFHRNLEACGRMYGKPCPYFDKCWNNKETGLEKKDENKK